MDRKPKVIIIGLDGASLEVIRPWIESGSLPNLRSIMENGSRGDLTTIVPPSTAPAWSSLYTGKNPGKHGIFEFLKRKQGTYDFVPINASMRDSKDLWEILSDHGKKVVIFNVPIAYPPRKVNGLFVAGFLTPSDSSEYTYPPSLKDELRTAIPDYRIGTAKLSVFRGWDRYVEDLQSNVKKRTEACLYLMKRSDWDLFMAVFSETDNIQHTLWAYMDKEYPSVSDRDRERYGHSIQHLYQTVDEAIGKLLSEVPKDTYVFIVSDHGAWPIRRIFHTNHFLKEIGLFGYKSSMRTRLKSFLHRIGVEPMNTKGFKPLNLFRFGLWGIAALASYRFHDIDWSITSAYSLGSGQIFINTQGREPNGIVGPGSELEEVKQKIIDALKSVQDPSSGEKVVDKIYLKEEIYSGPHIDEAPDIQFLTSKGFAAFPYGFIVNTTFTDTLHFSGTHSMKGIFMLKGPGVVKKNIKDLSIIDVAPTVLQIMGIPIPTDTDGKVLTQAFTKSHLDSKRVSRTSPTPTGPAEVRELSIGEQQQIEERLRSLGYLG